MTHISISPLCHFRANAYGVPSNPVGAPAGGISAVRMVLHSNQQVTFNRNGTTHVSFRAGQNLTFIR